jgi:hypothetical protein
MADLELGTLIFVEWEDAWSDDIHWLTLPEARESQVKPLMTGTIGWVVRADDDHVVIAQNQNANGQYSCFMTIPTGMVRSARNVKVKRG